MLREVLPYIASSRGMGYPVLPVLMRMFLGFVRNLLKLSRFVINLFLDSFRIVFYIDFNLLITLCYYFILFLTVL